MSVQHQLLNIYLLHLNQAILDERLHDNEKDPTVYNMVYHLHKHYASIGHVPMEDREHILSAIKVLLNEDYLDFSTDNEIEGKDSVSFEDFLKDWKDADFHDDYGGNGCYSIYLMTLNTLKAVYRLFV